VPEWNCVLRELDHDSANGLRNIHCQKPGQRIFLNVHCFFCVMQQPAAGTAAAATAVSLASLLLLLPLLLLNRLRVPVAGLEGV